MRDCERCGAKSPTSIDAQGRAIQGLNDYCLRCSKNLFYCLRCSKNLCAPCMLKGCCGRVPAESGTAAEDGADETEPHDGGCGCRSCEAMRRVLGRGR